jgi:hypothetical protein
MPSSSSTPSKQDRAGTLDRARSALRRRRRRPAADSTSTSTSTSTSRRQPSTSTSAPPSPAGADPGGPAGERPPIDPRIRARRIEVARGTGRRRLRRIGVGALVVAAGAAGWGVAQSALLDVDRIEVEGAEQTGQEAVRSAIGIDPGDPLVSVDLGGAEEAVAELPWVASATVHRGWPGSIRVAVEERRAVAAVRAGAPDAEPAEAPRADGDTPADDLDVGPEAEEEAEAEAETGEEAEVETETGEQAEGETEEPLDAATEHEAVDWMLLSADGHQLARVVGPLAGDLVVIEGVEPDDRPGDVLDGAVGALRAIGVVPQEFRSQLLRVRIEDDGDLEAVVAVDGGAGGEMAALLGPPVELPEKMVALATVVEQADLRGATGINVRVPSSPVLTREQDAE